MNVELLCFFVAITVAVAAPTGDALANTAQVGDRELIRDKRSNYGVPYTSPCSAASSPMPANAPYHVAPMHPSYAHPHTYGYGVPHPYYRFDDFGEENDMLSFSDVDHIPEHMARYAYAPPASHIDGPTGHLLAPTSSGPAFGVFPNANIGRCNVPLLFSCSPNIVPGRIVKGHPQYSYGPAVDTYRGVDSPHLQDEEHHEDQPVHGNAVPVHDVNKMAAGHA